MNIAIRENPNGTFKASPSDENLGEFQLSPIVLNPDYAKKWNCEHTPDFCHMTRNGEIINNSLIRKGGFGGKFKDGYVVLIKYVEAFYDDSITKDPLRKPHLDGQWCIFDKNGVEKVNTGTFKNPYHCGGLIYSIEQKYYNIETGEFYCHSYKQLDSDDFVFLENPYDKDVARRGVFKINKKDGSYEFFKGK